MNVSAALGLAGLLVLLDACTPPPARTADDLATKIYRYLWPPKPQPPTVAAPEQKSEPVAIMPANNAPAAAAVETAVPEPRPKPKPRPKTKTAVDDGPDLPWPCWQVRLYALGKTEAELTALEWRHGVALSAKQRRQAVACFDGYSRPIQ